MALISDELEEERANWDEDSTIFGSPYRWALPYVKGKVVADFCCGLGQGVRIMAPVVDKVIGFDYSEIAIAECNKNEPENGSFWCVDVEDENWGTACDVITCMQGLEHLKDPKKLINKFKDRTWIFALPHEDSLQIKHHKTLISDELIRGWFGDRVKIWHFNDSGERWLPGEDRYYTNFFGVHKP